MQEPDSAGEMQATVVLPSNTRPGIAEFLVLIGCLFWGPLIWIRDALGGWWDFPVFDTCVFVGMVITFLILPLALIFFASGQLFGHFRRSSVLRVALGLTLIIFVWSVPTVPGRLDWAWRQHRGQFEQAAVSMMAGKDAKTVNLGFATAERGKDHVSFRTTQVKDTLLVYTPNDQPAALFYDGISRYVYVKRQLDAHWSICVDDLDF